MLTCTITSPEKTTNYKALTSITLPAWSGAMQVLTGHAESFIVLQAGTVLLNKGTPHEQLITITDAICHILKNTVTIML